MQTCNLWTHRTSVICSRDFSAGSSLFHRVPQASTSSPYQQNFMYLSQWSVLLACANVAGADSQNKKARAEVLIALLMRPRVLRKDVTTFVCIKATWQLRRDVSTFL